MATAQGKTRKLGRYSASDELIKWMEGMAGLLAHIRTEYGGVSELLENPHWNPARNTYASSLIAALHQDIGKLAREFKEHVNDS
jgi:hypothetical protein